MPLLPALPHWTSSTFDLSRETKPTILAHLACLQSITQRRLSFHSCMLKTPLQALLEKECTLLREAQGLETTEYLEEDFVPWSSQVRCARLRGILSRWDIEYPRLARKDDLVKLFVENKTEIWRMAVVEGFYKEVPAKPFRSTKSEPATKPAEASNSRTKPKSQPWNLVNLDVTSSSGCSASNSATTSPSTTTSPSSRATSLRSSHRSTTSSSASTTSLTSTTTLTGYSTSPTSEDKRRADLRYFIEVSFFHTLRLVKAGRYTEAASRLEEAAERCRKAARDAEREFWE